MSEIVFTECVSIPADYISRSTCSWARVAVKETPFCAEAFIKFVVLWRSWICSAIMFVTVEENIREVQNANINIYV
jgi:hypothetical protein